MLQKLLSCQDIWTLDLVISEGYGVPGTGDFEEQIRLEKYLSAVVQKLCLTLFWS